MTDNKNAGDRQGLTYADAGVDIDAGAEAVELMKQHVKKTFRPEVMTDLGGFGGLFALNSGKYKNPVLVSGTDGVGTKLMVAFKMDKHDTIGIDAVAMCANDILVQGAEPLFFLDYLAVGKLVPGKVADIVKGVAEGCKQAGCALIGGETAEMPGFYGPGEYDIAGFVVGVVDRDKIIDGRTVAPGDAVIGLPSSGLHSNGYSLARKVLLEVSGYSVDSYVEELERTVGEEMLEPTRIYARQILPLLEKYEIKGMAHITGGGLTENIPRILPAGTKVVLDPEAWPGKAVFRLIREIGGVSAEEMNRTFNMGIGMAIVAPADQAGSILSDLAELGEKAYVIGRVEEGTTQVEFRTGEV
ncbi:MAG: phosphoribosylformylglycinamidine cyclo-ligase [Thermincola sp.]|jgi:phosphoribosylformylglycinamidine cyclo-ligase|nr:phosphoribosylformylglycinamidine cyclo-ligase [Thermincola sp.]MDT3704469.1 phosphoribosylformylglycinamidine cyclo-ligase [Thermincola sp.]